MLSFGLTIRNADLIFANVLFIFSKIQDSVNAIWFFPYFWLYMWFKVIYPKYSKHLLFIVAHTIDCVCSKILNNGLLFSVFKFFGWNQPIFCLPKWLKWAPMFIVHGMYNFDVIVNILSLKRYHVFGAKVPRGYYAVT